MKATLIACALVIGVASMGPGTSGASPEAFDHEYRSLAEVLEKHVRFPRVDYAALKADRTVLDRVVEEFIRRPPGASPAGRASSAWRSGSTPTTPSRCA